LSIDAHSSSLATLVAHVVTPGNGCNGESNEAT
jgi:hypothetical protein